jgi:Na+/phosphate symporter
MSAKAIVITLVFVFIGAAYLMMALLGPLKDVNMGLGLTAGLAAQKIAGGYSMANVVLFIVFLVVIGVLAYLMIGVKKDKKS